MLFVVMNHTHGKSAPWPWYQIIAFPWCCSQHLADCWQAEGFLYTNVVANFSRWPSRHSRKPERPLETPTAFGPWTKEPYKRSMLWIQDGRDWNPILHKREDWGPRKLEGKWCSTAMHHSFLHLDFFKKEKKRKKNMWQKHGLIASFHSEKAAGFHSCAGTSAPAGCWGEI